MKKAKTSGRLTVTELGDGYHVTPWYNLRGKWLAEVSGMMPGDRCKVTAERGKITIEVMEASDVAEDRVRVLAREILKRESELATLKARTI